MFIKHGDDLPIKTVIKSDEDIADVEGDLSEGTVAEIKTQLSKDKQAVVINNAIPVKKESSEKN